MKKLLYIIFISSIIISCSAPKDNKKEFTVITNSKTSQLDSLYSKLYNEGKFNGTVLIAEKGNIIYENAFGTANESQNKELNVASIFELASVSKQFTAMGIVQLKKQGLINYEDDISKYIPEFEPYKGITIENLLVHTSGLPDYMELAEEKWDKSKIATNQDIIQLFKDYQPETLFRPNERYEYSNTGYLLLATIIERVSEVSFESYLKEKIFDPAQMSNTSIHRRRFAPKKIENYADGYVFSDSLKRLIIPDSLKSDQYVIFLDGIVGDGMVNSNLRDLLKWDRILYTDDLVDSLDSKQIFSSYYTTDSTATDYGFGWEIDSLKAYGKIAEHEGIWAGYVTYIERHLDNKKTIIVLQNHMTEKTEIPLKTTRKILYGIPIERPIKLDSSFIKEYTGVYLSDSNGETELIYKNGGLYYPYPPKEPQVNLELIPVSKVKFILENISPEVTYTFAKDNKGEVINCRIQQIEQGIDQTLIKKK